MHWLLLCNKNRKAKSKGNLWKSNVLDYHLSLYNVLSIGCVTKAHCEIESTFEYFAVGIQYGIQEIYINFRFRLKFNIIYYLKLLTGI